MCLILSHAHIHRHHVYCRVHANTPVTVSLVHLLVSKLNTGKVHSPFWVLSSLSPCISLKPLIYIINTKTQPHLCPPEETGWKWWDVRKKMRKHEKLWRQEGKRAKKKWRGQDIKPVETRTVRQETIEEKRGQDFHEIRGHKNMGNTGRNQKTAWPSLPLQPIIWERQRVCEGETVSLSSYYCSI